MSLSFVKSAVLSSSDGVSHNTEEAINNPETTSLRASSGHKPLFEQLRANKEAEEEQYEEMQRQMRGTRTLDDEDCAHLDAVDRMRCEKEMEVRSGIEREVALFRAARVDRGLARTASDDEEEDGVETNSTRAGGMKVSDLPMKKETKTIVPKFTIKKKRKRVSSQQLEQKNESSGRDESDALKDDNQETLEKNPKYSQGKNNENPTSNNEDSKPKDDSESDNEGGGLLGLGCYGSDSD